MRFSVALFTAALAAVASANPMPVPEATKTLVEAKHNGTNGTHHKSNSTGHHNPHKEPTPIFKQPCDCPAPIVPADILNTQEKCEFEYAAAMGCYFRAAGGCPSPVPACTISY